MLKKDFGSNDDNNLSPRFETNLNRAETTQPRAEKDGPSDNHLTSHKKIMQSLAKRKVNTNKQSALFKTDVEVVNTADREEEEVEKQGMVSEYSPKLKVEEPLGDTEYNQVAGNVQEFPE